MLIDDQAYQGILQEILKCATNCYFKGKQQLEPAEAAIKEEYMHCMNEVYKLLGGKVKQ